MPGFWQNSHRRDYVSPNWERLRGRVLAADGFRCTALDDGWRCQERATDVDHIRPVSQGGTDAWTNLTSLCPWHHGRKSSAEGNNARTRPTERRQPEPHPGRVTH